MLLLKNNDVSQDLSIILRYVRPLEKSVVVLSGYIGYPAEQVYLSGS
jgi:hypothetical protein